jgi:hypothetical protein
MQKGLNAAMTQAAGDISVAHAHGARMRCGVLPACGCISGAGQGAFSHAPNACCLSFSSYSYFTYAYAYAGRGLYMELSLGDAMPIR